jgi:hypothetical protein
MPFEQKPTTVEEALLEDIGEKVGDTRRFVPFVMMHEFEGLLFSDCEAVSRAIGQLNVRGKLEAIRNEFDSPEEIDDSPDTAPSKRVAGIIAGYEKPLHGVLGIIEIGLPRIRSQCPHFDDWLCRLESIP